MESPVKKRSAKVDGLRTSFSMEDAFFDALKEIARERQITIQDLIGEVNKGRQLPNLSSSLRVFIIEHLRSKSIRT